MYFGIDPILCNRVATVSDPFHWLDSHPHKNTSVASQEALQQEKAGNLGQRGGLRPIGFDSTRASVEPEAVFGTLMSRASDN